MLMATTPCWASMDEARHAREEGEREDFQDALDAKVQAEYIDMRAGTGFAPEFIESALQKIPIATLLKMEQASKGYGKASNHDVSNHAACNAFGAVVLDFLLMRAYDNAEAEMKATS